MAGKSSAMTSSSVIQMLDRAPQTIRGGLFPLLWKCCNLGQHCHEMFLNELKYLRSNSARPLPPLPHMFYGDWNGWSGSCTKSSVETIATIAFVG